jgi:hypothetical protein
MESVRLIIDPFLEILGRYLPNAFGALFVFLLGYFLAVLLRKALAGLLGKLKVDERLAAKLGNPVGVEQFATNLLYYLVLLSILLLTLDILGVKGALIPVASMFNNFLGVIPNIVAALLIGFVGYVIARIISSATEVVARGLDNLSGKLGVGREVSISRLLSQAIFILIFIPVLISALDALKIEAISVPATRMLTELLIAIPKILAAMLILAIAYIAGRFLTSMLRELLQNIGADTLPSKIGIPGIVGDDTSFAKLCSGIVFFFIMLAAAVSAMEQLSMPQLSHILGEFLVFSGQIIIGLIILAVGNFIAGLAHNALSRTADNKSLAGIARIAILGLVLAMGLRAMGLADDIVNLAFGLTLGSVAVTVALAFGLGGREAAGKLMEHWLSKFRKPE